MSSTYNIQGKGKPSGAKLRDTVDWQREQHSEAVASPRLGRENDLLLLLGVTVNALFGLRHSSREQGMAFTSFFLWETQGIMSN